MVALVGGMVRWLVLLKKRIFLFFWEGGNLFLFGKLRCLVMGRLVMGRLVMGRLVMGRLVCESSTEDLYLF